MRRKRPKVSPIMSAGVILVDPQGCVLLQLRDDSPEIMFPGHWGITGGAALEGETPEQTAVREVMEETGLCIECVDTFKVYSKSGPRRGSRYETHYFYASTDRSVETMTVGEGRELRFFAPEEIEGIPIAYGHKEVLADFLASPHYKACLNGGLSAEEDEALAHLRGALASGANWFTALVEAVALWQRQEEVVDGRRFRYLIDGEAFDWLLLAQRLCEAACDAIPQEEREVLLFFGRPPVKLGDGEFKKLIGSAKHRAHLNYLYGVIVEEALQLAVEEELHKERRCRAWSGDRHDGESAFERVYGKPREELLAEFRRERSLPQGDSIAYADLKDFAYWLFKYRLRRCDPARVASDTRKALVQLSELEAASRRRQRLREGVLERAEPASARVVDVVVDVEKGTR
jgi:8-oxo-dGTP pyrophosphatase MutT (NUDIX family)